MSTTGLNMRLLYITALLFPLQLVCGCSKQADVTGTWQGTIDTSSMPRTAGEPENKPIGVVLEVHREGDQLKASVSTPDESPEIVPAESVEFKNESLVVKVPRRKSVYEARINSAGTELRGSFKQNPYNLPVSFKKSPGL